VSNRERIEDVYREWAAGQASRIAVEQTHYAVWTFRDGEVIRVRWTLARP
jgi:hypothetical protein